MTSVAKHLELKNDLLLRVFRGESVERPPVWMMRQAGRFLPDFRKLREKYSFFERAETPELAAEITVMPIDQVGVDAAILFSDILVIPKALGMDVQMVPGIGPVLQKAIRNGADLEQLNIDGVLDRLQHVMDAIHVTNQMLDCRVPLLGFAGAPWTVFCYMVEGQGSKNFDAAKTLMYQQPEVAERLMQMITDATIGYINRKVEAGVHGIQIFDSWGGMLSKTDYMKWSHPYIKQIIHSVTQVPTIIYAKGTWHVIKELAEIGSDAMSIDWTMDPGWARKMVGEKMVLQGNLDPAILLGEKNLIRERTLQMLKSFTPGKHIANLGHGMLPTVLPDHAQVFIDTIKAYRYEEL